jgi:hypothetical protein
MSLVSIARRALAQRGAMLAGRPFKHNRPVHERLGAQNAISLPLKLKRRLAHAQA